MKLATSFQKSYIGMKEKCIHDVPILIFFIGDDFLLF